MSKVSDILKSARASLADTNEERWTDDRLINLLDEGQKYIARMYELLVSHSSIPITRGQANYKMFPDLWLILRCAFKCDSVSLKSYQDMDETKQGWMCDEGDEIEAVLYDHRNPQELMVYPTPSENFKQDYEHLGQSDFGVMSSAIEGVVDPFGVSTNVDTDTDELYSSIELTDEFGVVSGTIVKQNLFIGYVKDPKKLTSLDDELELPQMFDRALKLYVVSQAFADDLDTEFQKKSQLVRADFENELAKLGNRLHKFDGTVNQTPINNYKGFM